MNQKSEIINTGDLVINPQSGKVQIGNNEIALGPVNMQVLLVLIQNHEKIVSRKKIFDTVWKNQTVSDDTLTKCISELRIRLSQYSKEKKLISTFPKRGYQWVPAIYSKREKHKSTFSLKWPIIGLLVLITVIYTTFTLTKIWNDTRFIRMVLIPVQSNPDSTQSINLIQNTEDLLRQAVLQTDTLRFLSKNTVSSNQHFPYLRFATEYGVRWILEIRTRTYNDKVIITLSLIDSRTSLEVYSQNYPIDSNPNEIELLTQSFIQDIKNKSGS